MIRARFRLPVAEDTWVHDVTTAFPEATLKLLTGVPMGDRALELGEVRAENPLVVTEAIRSHADVVSYDQLYEDDERAMARYEARERGLYEFLWASDLTPEFPVIAERGEIEFDVTATRDRFEAFGDMLEAHGHEYDLLSVVHAAGDDRLLTDRQREALTVAHRMGFFAVPRDCTVDELGDALGVYTSSASETVRRATARVVEHYLTGTG